MESRMDWAVGGPWPGAVDGVEGMGIASRANGEEILFAPSPGGALSWVPVGKFVIDDHAFEEPPEPALEPAQERTPFGIRRREE